MSSKRWIRDRMAKSGHSYQKELQLIRKEAEQLAKDKGISTGQAMAILQNAEKEGES